MRALCKDISRLERLAARCDDTAGVYFDQAAGSNGCQNELMELGFAFRLQGGRFKLQANELRLSLPAVIGGELRTA